MVEVEARNGDAATLKAREAHAIQEKIPVGSSLVTLDERGKALTSLAFATWSGARQRDGTVRVCFVLGGADGLDPSLLAASTLSLAFGTLTWPHMLARVMLFEQLYRAQQILAGHPYHRA